MMYSIFRLDTGLITGHMSCGAKSLARNVREGFGAILGARDAASQRVIVRTAIDPVTGTGIEAGDIVAIDAETGEPVESLAVVDYQPPRPSVDHEWNAETKRWQLTKEAIERDQRDTDARTEIGTLESRQLRVMRELILDRSNMDAVQRIDAIEARIAELRPQLKR